jgi:hypothetical protein
MASRLRSNDLYYSYGSDSEDSQIRVVHIWVREYDGRISEFMINADNQRRDFLYRRIGRFASTYQAFTIFTFGVGTNGETMACGVKVMTFSPFMAP